MKLKRDYPYNIFKDSWISSDYWAMNKDSYKIVMAGVMAAMYGDAKHYNTAADNGIVFW